MGTVSVYINTGKDASEKSLYLNYFFASVLKYIFSSYKECNVTMYISSFKEFWLFLSLIIVVPIGVLIQNNSVLVLDFLGSPPPAWFFSHYIHNPYLSTCVPLYHSDVEMM